MFRTVNTGLLFQVQQIANWFIKESAIVTYIILSQFSFGSKWNYLTKVPYTYYLEVNFNFCRDHIIVAFVNKNIGNV